MADLWECAHCHYRFKTANLMSDHNCLGDQCANCDTTDTTHYSADFDLYLCDNCEAEMEDNRITKNYLR